MWAAVSNRVVGGIIVNMAFSVGDDGIIMVDSNFGDLTEKIVAAIREVSDEPIRFLIDTHSHADHADGNANFARSGAILIAHRFRAGGGLLSRPRAPRRHRLPCR